MTIMLGRLYDALTAAGADPKIAREAAEEVASYEAALSLLKSDINLMKWMIAFNLAMTSAILWKVFAA